jgi:hypothetical protein
VRIYCVTVTLPIADVGLLTKGVASDVRSSTGINIQSRDAVMSPSSYTHLLLYNVIIVMSPLLAVTVRLPSSSTSSSAVDEIFYQVDRQSPNLLQLSSSVEGDVFDRSVRSGSVSSPVGRPVCEPITVTLCSALRYNATRMPNLVGHMTQLDAAEHINAFLPLIQTGCSRLLKFFLCSIYTPMCTEQVGNDAVVAVNARCQVL